MSDMEKAKDPDPVEELINRGRRAQELVTLLKDIDVIVAERRAVMTVDRCPMWLNEAVRREMIIHVFDLLRQKSVRELESIVKEEDWKE
jgi:hypothetical protein